MVLAPGCLWMLTMTAGVLIHPRGLPDIFDVVFDIGHACSSGLTGAPFFIRNDSDHAQSPLESNWSLAPI